MVEAGAVEMERLVRLETQIEAMRSDLAEIKSNIGAFLTAFGNMHKEFIPRVELEKQMALDMERMNKLETAIEQNAKEIGLLENKWWGRPPWWLTLIFTTGGGMLAGLVVGIVTGHVRVR